MADTIVRLDAGDYDELVDFLNTAFGKDDAHSFEKLLPAWYKPTDQLMAMNYAIRREGKIAANVGLFPFDWSVGGRRLKCAGVGGVAVGHAYRGQGLMRVLMDEVTRIIRDDGYDISYLGGHRQRYRYWGWEVGGNVVLAHIIAASTKHSMVEGWEDVTLSPAGHDAAELARLRAMHDALPSHCVRTDGDYSLYLRTHVGTSYVGRRGGKVIGYLSMSADHKLAYEVVADRADDAQALLHAAVREVAGEGFMLQLQQMPTTLMYELGDWVQGMVVHGSGNYQVFDWVKVLGAFMKMRDESRTLPEGRVKVEIDGQVMDLIVDERGGRCEAAEGSTSIFLTGDEAVRLFFGAVRPALVTSLPRSEMALLHAWCPLPVHLPTIDHV